ncbi:hypothetical protein DNTS_007182 [Danionella cerebrum]|uniref:Uncharacterized protein n=1 Tax=Danionella cerebrum TaxID=2873325 RepID=A0A553N4R3_9TELE|nr:hypothetical protein DNTS_007182 [Danionella translucida]
MLVTRLEWILACVKKSRRSTNHMQGFSRGVEHAIARFSKTQRKAETEHRSLPKMAMFGGRGGKGGKFSVEDLYGISKKPKASSGTASSGAGAKQPLHKGKGPKGETDALASQILEAAQRLVERRRLELYLREFGISINECQSERHPMLYRWKHLKASSLQGETVICFQPLVGQSFQANERSVVLPSFLHHLDSFTEQGPQEHERLEYRVCSLSAGSEQMLKEQQQQQNHLAVKWLLQIPLLCAMP